METRLAMRMYQEYTTFFQKAERERRWNPFDDIPWDKVNKDASEELALCAETFCGVEMYLPDYVAGGLNVVRKCFGQAWFQANWAYEESKHALVLTEYLLRSGKRTDEQMVDFQNRIFDKTWERPFDTARMMTLYGVIQEMATFVIYLKQRDRALAEKCEALHKIYDFIARDEIAHCRFYQGVVKVLHGGRPRGHVGRPGARVRQVRDARREARPQLRRARRNHALGRHRPRRVLAEGVLPDFEVPGHHAARAAASRARDASSARSRISSPAQRPYQRRPRAERTRVLTDCREGAASQPAAFPSLFLPPPSAPPSRSEGG